MSNSLLVACESTHHKKGYVQIQRLQILYSPFPEHYLSVRTYGEVSVFDIRNQSVTALNPIARPISLSETFTVQNPELNEGEVMDMFLSTSATVELHVVNDQGSVYHCMQRGEHKAM